MASSPAQSLLQLDGCGQASTKTIGGSRGEYRSVAYHHPRWCGRGIGATGGAGVELALSCTCACEELHYGTTKSNNREGEGGEGRPSMAASTKEEASWILLPLHRVGDAWWHRSRGKRGILSRAWPLMTAQKIKLSEAATSTLVLEFNQKIGQSHFAPWNFGDYVE